jgi:secreted Zn-dependent insulinase-like peptidase
VNKDVAGGIILVQSN